MKPSRLVETRARKSSAVYSVNAFTTKMPAFATTASIEPNFLRASSATLCAVSICPMSPSINARWSEAESSLDFVAFRAVPTTLYPRARNAWTTPAPMPCDAPVTITVFRLLAIRSAQRFEPRAKFGHEDLRLFPRREVSAFVDLVVVDELGIRLLRPAPRGLIELVRKPGHSSV